MHANPQRQKPSSDIYHDDFVTTPVAVGDAMDDSDQNAVLAKVRDLLFGEQVRETAIKQSELESRVNRSIGQLRKDVFQQLDALNRELRQSVLDLEKNLLGESRRRDEQLESINNQATDVRKTIAQLAEQSHAVHQSLNERIDAESNRIDQDLRKRQSEIESQLNALEASLRESKADRHVLAELFSEMSSRLLNPRPA